VSSPLFAGASSLRHRGERLALVLTVVVALPVAYAIGSLIHERIGPPEVALFIVFAMLYVTLARGRLIGSSVMIHEAQYPRVFAIVRRACAALEIPMPLVFVRDDYHVAAAALGFGEPYALVLSSNWIEHFEDDELAFVIGRQLGHIAAGHTRFLSLLSVNGNENPIVALIFGAWLRCCEYTCDLVGLLVCGSLDAATRAIAVNSFHHFGRHVDMAQFAEQGREIAKDGVLRWGEWLGAEPYATNRIAAMRAFETSAQFANLEAWFLRDVALEPPTLPNEAHAHVDRSDCAGLWRRIWAVLIDAVVVAALLLAFNNANNSQSGTTASAEDQGAPVAINVGSGQKGKSPININGGGLDVNIGKPAGERHAAAEPKTRTWRMQPDDPLYPFANAFGRYVGSFGFLPLYLAVLVGFTGQSFGMMITGLRVVTTDFRAPGLWRSIWRYGVGLITWPLIVCMAPVMPRILLHDRLSGTRLIRAERILARAATGTAVV
jgi:Zn-dependent protease with chaperone function/uncharacterized RDD family membrane protein YckC